MLNLAYWEMDSNLHKKTMSVPEMQKILGLGKTDAYWLAHKGKFKVYEINGMFRVDIDSFEKWYAGQIKYHKVDGPPPGEKLRQESYSVKELAEMLEISEGWLYEILLRDGVETILVDHWKRVPKEAFEEWYTGQNRYRTKEDKERDREIEENSIWLPDVARMLGIDRRQVYTLMCEARPRGSACICECPDGYKLMYGKQNRENFDIVEVASRKRVTKESFFAWYESQDDYRILTEEERRQIEESHAEELLIKKLRRLPANKSTAKNAMIYHLQEPKNPNFYTMEEIVEFYGFRRATVLEWLKKGNISAVKVGKAYRFPREDFDDWLDMKST